jgi:hypothetical protein
MTTRCAQHALKAYRKASETALPESQQRGVHSAEQPALTVPAFDATGRHSHFSDLGLYGLAVALFAGGLLIVLGVAWLLSQAFLLLGRILIAGWCLL